MNRTYRNRVCRVEVPGNSVSEKASRNAPAPRSSIVVSSRNWSTASIIRRRCSASTASQAKVEGMGPWCIAVLPRVAIPQLLVHGNQLLMPQDSMLKNVLLLGVSLHFRRPFADLRD